MANLYLEVFFMQKKSKPAFSLRLTVALAMLVAISIILGKYLAFSVGEVLRFSFENLPIIFAGIAFGPLAAVLVAVCADLVGCLLVGFTPIPLVTVGAAVTGLISGLIPLVFGDGDKRRSRLSITLTASISHLFGSVIVKTLGLATFYDMNIFILILWRILNYAIVASLEAVILCLLLKNRAVKEQITKIKS